MKPESSRRRVVSMAASLWPTTDDTREVMRSAVEDSVNQILRGEGVYYGLPSGGVVSESRIDRLAYLRDLAVIDRVLWM